MASAAVITNRRPSDPASAGAAAAAVPMLAPFRVGATEKRSLAFDVAVPFGAVSTQVGPLDIPSGGYLRHVDLEVEIVTAANAAAVAFHADAPFNVLTDVTLVDVNGTNIVGPLSGYELYLANLFGGYVHDSDPTRDPNYLAVVGAGATGGSVYFMIRIPVEAVARDAVCALGNGAANATIKVRFGIAPSTQVYSTPPTTVPATLRVRAWHEVWTQPGPVSLKGVPVEQQPPGHGSVQRWSRNQPNVLVGSNTVRLSQMGNLLRTLVFVFRDAAGARAIATAGTEFILTFEDRDLENVPLRNIRRTMQERYGYLAAQLPLGVYVYDFSHDFDGKPGFELRDLWFPTTQASRLELKLNGVTVAGSVTILTNDVVPYGDALLK